MATPMAHPPPTALFVSTLMGSTISSTLATLAHLSKPRNRLFLSLPTFHSLFSFDPPFFFFFFLFLGCSYFVKLFIHFCCFEVFVSFSHLGLSCFRVLYFHCLLVSLLTFYLIWASIELCILKSGHNSLY